MSNQHQDNPFIPDSIQMGIDHWNDEIAFLEDRLSGNQGEIDEEDKDSCLEALKIARGNLADAIKHSQASIEKS